MNTEGEERTEGLARIARDGDPEAFARLFNRLRGRLEVWISIRMGALLRSRLTPEDALQETFLEAFRSLTRFRDQGPGSFQRWLFSIAENRLRDLSKFHNAQKRSARRDVSPDCGTDGAGDLLKQLAAATLSPSAGVHREEMTRELAESIRQLPEPLKEVLVLRAIEERTYAEISETLGRPQATVRVLFCRALKRLRDEFGTRSDA